MIHTTSTIFTPTTMAVMATPMVVKARSADSVVPVAVAVVAAAAVPGVAVVAECRDVTIAVAVRVI